MIDKITLFKNNIKYKTMSILRNYAKTISFGLPKLKELKQDILELKQGLPDVLMTCPPITEGHFNTGVHDKRFINFSAEYRAYNFEGYEKFPNEYVCIDSKGDRRLKPHVYFKYVEIRPEFARQGIYSNAVKRLIEMARLDKDCEGRIILDARKIESPTITKIPSPSLAHWKCGFRFIDKDNNIIMKRVLKGELPLNDAPEGSMYYPLT